MKNGFYNVMELKVKIFEREGESGEMFVEIEYSSDPDNRLILSGEPAEECVKGLRASIG